MSNIMGVASIFSFLVISSAIMYFISRVRNFPINTAIKITTITSIRLIIDVKKPSKIFADCTISLYTMILYIMLDIGLGYTITFQQIIKITTTPNTWLIYFSLLCIMIVIPQLSTWFIELHIALTSEKDMQFSRNNLLFLEK